MRQVFYIEADEEMISVIGRLRKSPATENFIVAPVRSLILQSIVNLRLLNHDARKNGKEIIVVTQDAQSRSLCEKAGIRTQTALDDEYEYAQSGQQPMSSPAAGTYPMMPPSAPMQPLPLQSQSQTEAFHQPNGWHLPYSESLGSADFFGGGSMPSPASNMPSGMYREPSSPQPQQSFQMPSQFQPQPQPQQWQPPQTRPAPSMESLSKSPYGNAQQVTVRDKNPQSFATLNSQRFEEEKRLQQQKSFTPPSLRGAPSARPVFPPPPSVPPVTPSSPAQFIAPRPIAAPPAPSSPQPHQGFLEHRRMEAKAPVPQKMPEKPVPVSGGSKMRAFFIFFGFISVISVAAVGAYVFLPKATLHVKLKVATQKADFTFGGSPQVTAPSVDERIIPVRIIEQDQEMTRSFDATGKASLADQKARGSVIIYNQYSADPQLLVASTRLISQDGKVFRLVSGVIVPGMTTNNGSNEPGAIEALVTADQPGADYNIPATTFTIPGFQGGAKYTKFSAKSSSPMSGGGMSGSDATAVSDEDVVNAKKAMEADVKTTAEESISRNLAAGEKILSEAIDTTIVSSIASPAPGAVTDVFEYRIKMHIRAFVFSEDDLKKMTSTLFDQQNQTKGFFQSPSSIDVQYGEPNADFTAGTLRINVHAIARFESTIDAAQLKSDLLGQNESDITALLKKYTQVDTIALELWPEWLSKRIPTREDRVTVIIDPLDGPSAK